MYLYFDHNKLACDLDKFGMLQGKKVPKIIIDGKAMTLSNENPDSTNFCLSP